MGKQIFIVLFFFALNVFGASASVSIFDVMPVRNAGLENVVIDSQITASASSFTRINMHLGCFATNLRSVANPVSENSMVTAYLDLYDSGGAMQTYQVVFPAEFLKPASTRIYSQAQIQQMIKIAVPASGAYMQAFDNTIQLLVPHLKLVNVSASGEVANLSEKNLVFAGARFSQHVIDATDEASITTSLAALGMIFPAKYQQSQYTGYTGPLSTRLSWYVSNDTGSIDLKADFPGAARPGQGAVYQGETRTGFCGGFYSPLMLFFDDEMPMFEGKSKFKLIENQMNSIYWPEENSKGYFLVLDKNNNNKVDDGTELFGDSGGFKNGFENLAQYDLNKDGVIDHKDPIFKKLKLWNDKNGNGQTDKGELVSLSSMGITSINLKYISETKKFGDRAEYKQKSAFTFKNKKSLKKGNIVDIWLSTAGN